MRPRRCRVDFASGRQRGATVLPWERDRPRLGDSACRSSRSASPQGLRGGETAGAAGGGAAAGLRQYRTRFCERQTGGPGPHYLGTTTILRYGPFYYLSSGYLTICTIVWCIQYHGATRYHPAEASTTTTLDALMFLPAPDGRGTGERAGIYTDGVFKARAADNCVGLSRTTCALIIER